MKVAAGTKTALYVLGAIAALICIVWAESTTWLSVNELRARAETVSSDRFHLSDQLEARVHSLNNDVLRDSLEPTASRRQVIEAESKELRQWLAMHQTAGLAENHRELLFRASQLLERFIVHWELRSGAARGETVRPDWRHENEQLAAELLEIASALSRVEKTALSEFMTGTQEKTLTVHRQLILSSVVLLAMGALLGLIAYHGGIAPLRSRLAQSQAVIERQEKLSSLGVLAAGVAHEIRNPLTSIKARLFTQQNLLESQPEALEDNVFITEEISRLERIVADFLAFARPSEPRRERIRAARLVRDLEGLFRPALTKAAIRLQLELIDDPEVDADPSQIKQVLINLVQNAAESIGHDGLITLRTTLASKRRNAHGRANVVIEVADTGRGIPPEAQRRLFDPFFTTKPNGTGLGLSIAARIVEKHGGQLEFESGRDKGTLFRLTLPTAET